MTFFGSSLYYQNRSRRLSPGCSLCWELKIGIMVPSGLENRNLLRWIMAVLFWALLKIVSVSLTFLVNKQHQYHLHTVYQLRLLSVL